METPAPQIRWFSSDIARSINLFIYLLTYLLTYNRLPNKNTGARFLFAPLTPSDFHERTTLQVIVQTRGSVLQFIRCEKLEQETTCARKHNHISDVQVS